MAQEAVGDVLNQGGRMQKGVKLLAVFSYRCRYEWFCYLGD